MNVQETIDRLAAIVAKQEQLTTEDKQFVFDLCKQLSVETPKNKRCKSCWMDAALACADALKNSETTEELATEDNRKYVLKDGVDVLFGYPSSIRVNALTLTDELAEEIIARGFPKDLFKKCE